MEQLVTYVVLFSIIVLVGQLLKNSTIPISLVLVLVGMLLSSIPNIKHVSLDPNIVLHIFLPILIYQISSFSSWRDIKFNMRPIALLSIGHVVFMAFLVAYIIHALLPQLGWPLAFILGAVISPPDDVAIVSIAEKIRMPKRIVTILEGEGVLNDATALILFRFALIALVSHHFSAINAVSNFFIIVIGETLYGIAIGYGMGELRLKIKDTHLHIIASLLTPFIAYLPTVMLGGSGVLATVVAGFVIGHRYSVRFTPQFRLASRGLWPALSFSIENLLFLLVGLNLQYIIGNISSIPIKLLFLYSASVILTLIIGRFIWVYLAAYIPRWLFPRIRKKDPYPPWQYVFIIAWSGMRGSISLAAAFAVPFLPGMTNGANPRSLLIFLVFCVVVFTFVIQGLSLPWLLRVMGLTKDGDLEQYNEHLEEIRARVYTSKAVLRKLLHYKKTLRHNEELKVEVDFNLHKYYLIYKRQKELLKRHHEEDFEHDEQAELGEETFLVSHIIEAEKHEILKLWQQEKINLSVRNKLIDRLDHRTSGLPK